MSSDALPASWWLQSLVLPFGGLPAGLVLLALLRPRRIADGLPILGASVLVWALLVLPAVGLALARLEPLLGSEPLARLPWVLLGLLALAALLGGLGGAPFLVRPLRRAGADRPRLAALGRATLAWAAGLLVLASAFLWVGRCSLLGLRRAPAASLLPPRVAVYALEGDVLLRVDALGARVLRRGLPVDAEARVAFRPGTRELVLARRGGLEELGLSLPEGCVAAQAPPVAMRRKGAWELRPAGLEDAHGAPAVLEAPGGWEADLGTFAGEGLLLRPPDLGRARRLALELPGAAWAFRCGAWLPGGRLLVQAGPQLLLIDPAAGRAALLGRGRGPLAVLEP